MKEMLKVVIPIFVQFKNKAASQEGVQKIPDISKSRRLRPNMKNRMKIWDISHLDPE